MRVPAAVVAAALSAFAQAGAPQGLSPEVLAIARAMTTNRDLLKHLTLYTCLETISRTRPSTRRGSGSRDILQLDVGMGEHEEMYSWPGDTTFRPWIWVS